MTTYDTIASSDEIQAAQNALEANGFKVTVVDDRAAAMATVLELVPKGAEVLTMTSKTLDETGIEAAINQSGDYDAVRPKLNALYGDPSKKSEQRKLGAAPDYVIGSVHALTQDGKALIASNSGSQLGPYAYTAGQVIWVVGAQKITKDMKEANERLEQYVFPLENERAQQAYGMGSNISKLLHFNKEIVPGRVTIVIAKEVLGF